MLGIRAPSANPNLLANAGNQVSHVDGLELLPVKLDPQLGCPIPILRARSNVHYARGIAGVCSKGNGVAIDAQTIRLIRSSVSPAEFRQALDEMNPDARSDFLDAMLADDLVSMHSVYEFIHTYRTLGLFRYYKLLSQITDAEWDAVVDAMKREKKVGDPTRFQRAQYATLHAHEYELVGGDGSLIVGNDFAQWDLFQRYVNPYALFVRGIRKARVSSRDVRLAISGRNYLENLERLLDP